MTTLFKTTQEPSAPMNDRHGVEGPTKRGDDAKRLDARNRAKLYTARIWL